MSKNILLVDDDPVFCLSIEIYLKGFGFNIFISNSGVEANNYLKGTKNEISEKIPLYNLDFMLLDVNMPLCNGMDILRETVDYRKDLPVIIVTSEDDRNKAIDAMKLGAVDYLIKGQEDQMMRLLTCISSAEERRNLKHQIDVLKKDKEDALNFSDIIGKSKQILNVISLARKIADSEAPVFIGGESGVGKEVLAKAIHNDSVRNKANFVAVNCGAIPENLAESILFGHEKGSFTGAINKSIGKFREADGGTLFLDEIGELSLSMQVKLLRALQEKEIEPVGSHKTIKINVRIISATNRNLMHEVENGNFREDLYYRINVFPIYIPPLRERKEDIPLLITEFCNQFATQEQKNILGIEDEVLEMLKKYHWPGNIRQVKNAVFRAVILSENSKLDIEDFSHIISHNSHKVIDDHIVKIKNHDGTFKKIDEIQKEVILNALKFYNGNIKIVANCLNIDEKYIQKIIDQYSEKDK